MVRFLAVLGVVATVLVSATVADCETKTGETQMVTYVKRRPDFTRRAFWQYWESQHAPKVVPLATHFNITRYQQIQVGGMILPTEAGSLEPASMEPVEFDGIALFLYQDPAALVEMLSHPYYIDVVEPDEHKFIDKEAFGVGMVATFIGTHVEAVDDAQDVWQGATGVRNKYDDLFESYL